MKKSTPLDNINKPKVKYRGYSMLLEEAPMGNEVNWGDSLLGRLINSAIRKTKIGYNQTKIKDLLKAFRRELDGLIADGLQKETKDKLTALTLKGLLAELQNICQSDNDDDKKLTTLLGANENLWDATKPDGGLWEDYITSGYLLKLYEEIENNFAKEDLEKIDIPKNKLLDNVSDFIDNLRRFTSGSTASNVQSTRYRSFSANFGNVTNSLTQIFASREYTYTDKPINENVIYFSDFISEAEVSDQKKEDTAGPQGKVDKIDQSKKSNNQSSGSQGQVNPENTGTQGSKDTKGQTPSNVETPKGQTPSNIQTNISDVLGPIGDDKSASRLKKFKELAISAKDLEITDDEKDWPQALKRYVIGFLSLTSNDLKNFIDKNKNFRLKIKNDEGKEFKKDILVAIRDLFDSENFYKLSKTFGIKGPRIFMSNSYVMKNQVFSKEEKIEEFKKRLELTKLAVANNKDSQIHPKSIIEIQNYLKQLSINEGVLNFKSYRLFEADEPPSVEGLFDDFKSQLGLPEEFYVVTSRQIKDLDELSNNAADNLIIDLSTRPDPIIKIVRVFARAHDLYFTGTIPSGRSSGKVSNKTFREYIPLSKNYSGNQETPGWGPFANKKIYDRWRDGVLEVLEDQRYRKILANIKFVVPGSEDKFNPPPTAESVILKLKDYQKIFEKETTTTGDDKEKKSHGQLLFDFINEMLDKETAADFDSVREKLLRKYFGQFGFKAKSEEVPRSPRGTQTAKPPATEDLVAKSLFWQDDTSADFVCKGKNDSGYEGQIYFIPTIRDEESMCLMALKKLENDRYLVKFQFRSDETFQTKLTSGSPFNSWEWPKRFRLGNGPAPNNVYYGIIKKIEKKNGKTFKIVYSELKGNTYEDLVYKEFTIKDKTSGPTPIVCSVLWSADQTPTANKVLRKDFLQLSSVEKSSEQENLDIEKNGKKLLQALSDMADNKF